MQVVRKCLTLLLLFSTHCEIYCAELSYLSTRLSVPRPGTSPVQIDVAFPQVDDETREYLLERVVRAAAVTQNKMGAEFTDDFSIFFDPRPQFHNGLTTVIPTNRISVHLQAPELESTIGIFHDYVTETLVHEMSHMIVTQARGGIFRAFDYVVGNTSRPMGAWPRWLHEGMAVWTEAASGGRPDSGQIDFDLRQYAEYVERKKQHPIGNSDLDGNNNVERAEAGAFPYHFGYLMVDEWYKLREKKPWGQLFKEWSKSPGLSFRVLFKNDHQITLDEFFRAQQKKWAAYLLKVSESLKGEVWAHAPQISGPYSYRFRASNGKYVRSVAWIEGRGRNSAEAILKGKWTADRFESLDWKFGYSVPRQTFLSSQGWLVLYSQLSPIAHSKFLKGGEESRRFLGFFDFKGRELCRFQKLPERINEVAFSENEIAYIVADDLGVRQSVYRARFTDDCQVLDERLVAHSLKPFQRFSSLNLDQSGVSYSRQNDEAPYETIELNGEPAFAADAPLSLAYRWGDSWVAHRYARDAFAPIVFSTQSKSLLRPSKILPMRTGSTRSALGSFDDEGSKGFLLVKESVWEEDRLVKVDQTAFSNEGPSVSDLKSRASEKAKTEKNLKSESPLQETKAYSVWPSIVPQFWLPTAVAYSGGFLVYGQTFFSDLTERWSGTLVGGYDSYVTLPFFNFSLSRKEGFFYPFSAHGFSVYYAPSAVTLSSGKLIFQRSGSEISSQTIYFSKQSALRSSLNLGLRYEFGRSELSTSNFDYLSPFVQLNVSSPQAVNSTAPSFRLAHAGTGVSGSVRARKIRGAEYSATLQGVASLGNTAFSLRTEWAKTDVKNYPASYFEFGGNYAFSTSLLSFLSRGFAPRLGVGREIIRCEAQWGFPLTALSNGLSWNRLRMKQLDGRLIAESVTFSPFAPGHYALGHGYFSSVGGEFDLFGTLSQYVKYTATFGAYHGFGPYGENRLGLRITSYLDL